MKIKFLAVITAPEFYTIHNDFINGLDTSVFTEGAVFVGNEETQAAGIFDMKRRDGELYVTLGQCSLTYSCQPLNDSHDWLGGGWIDAADYDPSRCYIVASSAPEGAEYVKREKGWTVTMPTEDEELV